MSKLEKLIQDLCPNGVEYKRIDTFTNYEQPSRYIVKNTKYDNNFKTPVLTAGQTFILGYTNELDGIFQASKSNPVIIFDDFTGAFKWVDFPFKVKSSAIKFLTSKGEIVSLRYLFYMMGFLNFKSDEHKRLWISIYSKFRIPVPPMKVQNEIVRILDNFTELSARKKQYEYYRDSLFSNLSSNGVEYKSLEDCCTMLDRKRKPITKATRKTGEYPYYGANGIKDYVVDYIFDGTFILVGELGRRKNMGKQPRTYCGRKRGRFIKIFISLYSNCRCHTAYSWKYT